MPPETSLPPRFLMPADMTDIDGLVRQVATRLTQAHALAVRTIPGHNLDLLCTALEACEAWLGEGA